MKSICICRSSSIHSNCFLSVSGHEVYITDRSWGWWLLQVGTPLILMVGIPGNILSIVVLKSRKFRGKSYTHYLSALAVFDSLVLVFKYLNRVDRLIEATGYYAIFSQYDDVACKMHNFAEHVCYLMSSWLVLCMTMERYVAIVFPFKKDIFCKPRNAVTIILVLFAVMSYSQVFRLIIIEQEDFSCTAPDKYLHIYVAMHIYTYQLVLHFMLPAVCILLCNAAILFKVRRIHAHVTSNGSAHNYRPKRNKTTFMLLIVSFTYIVTVLPMVLLSMIMHISMRTDQSVARFIFVNFNDIRYVFELLSEVNYAANFYIYVMSGARFRYQLRQMCAQRTLVTTSGHS